MSMLSPAQIEDVKASVDIFTLAEQRTTLRKVARNEWAGPCPSAACDGDTDSVHVHADGWWFCRKCHEKRSDAIGFVMHYEGVNFVAACEWIAGPGMKLPAKPFKPQPAQRKPPQWDTDVWQQRAYELVEQAAARLESPDGAAARAYLEQRGITQHTWRCWLLGYTPDSPPWKKEQRRRVGGASITIPYIRHDDERIMAVRYRRIDPQADRYINEPGSACVLHGLHHINLNTHTLIVTEGELNAISIWQAARDLGVAVVSIGSQTTSEQALSAVAWLSKKFERCIPWCDEPNNVLAMRKHIQSPHVLPLQSPKSNGNKIDANDMLQRGLLRAFIERKLANADTRQHEKDLHA